MAGFKLSRDQLASFLKDHQQIKQFERLFDTASNAVTVDPATVDDGDYLYYDGTTLTWVAEAPGALTRVDDTNITLTLGGAPATALLKDVSLTAGWAGTLSIARGGTGSSNAVGALTNLGAAASTLTLTAGAGLTGGGNLSANRTFDIGAGAGITVNADDIALDTSSTRNTDHASVTLTAGVGLSGGGDLTASRTIDLENTAVTPATYGAANKSATIAVDQQGRITSASDTTITIAAVAGATPAANGTYLAPTSITIVNGIITAIS